MTSVEAFVPWLGGALALAGIAAAASRRRELMLRWCAWALGVPLVTGAFWLGPPGIAAVAAVAAVIGAVEYGGMLRLGVPDRVTLAAALVAVVLVVWLAPEQLPRIAVAGALAVVAVPLVGGDSEHGLHRAAFGLLGLAWLGLSAAMVPLGATALAVFIAVSAGDIAAYFAGARLGGPRLSPLSPAKRWSGTAAGAAAGIAVLGALSALTWPTAIAVALGGPAGDLLESMVKRGARVKDSGGWMAGSGGLLDRIDSLLAALAVLVVLS